MYYYLHSFLVLSTKGSRKGTFLMSILLHKIFYHPVLLFERIPVPLLCFFSLFLVYKLHSGDTFIGDVLRLDFCLRYNLKIENQNPT